MNIFIAGGAGMVGSAFVRFFKKKKSSKLFYPTRKDLDLLNFEKVNEFFNDNKIDYVYLAAAKVGGIYANNTFPADFIYENLQIQNNVIRNSYLAKIKKLLFLGSSCVYPKYISNKIKEKDLLTGLLEETNEPYAIAKIAGIKMCESFNRQYGTDYRSVMPTNLYGVNDNFNLLNSHVIPAIIFKIHNAKVNNIDKIILWGTGKPIREFLYVDDMIDASYLIMNISKRKYNQLTNYKNISHINIGSDEIISIKQLSIKIKKIIGYKGDIIFNQKLDGKKIKKLNNKILNQLNWKPKFNLESGINKTYAWFLKEKNIKF